MAREIDRTRRWITVPAGRVSAHQRRSHRRQRHLARRLIRQGAPELIAVREPGIARQIS